ncbi:MAG: hypothetical protein EBX40_06400 [Gammaproteobacteria bacterium]|nr:hypothetical protein [Gammaproteobacteria bacterium]
MRTALNSHALNMSHIRHFSAKAADLSDDLDPAAAEALKERRKLAEAGVKTLTSRPQTAVIVHGGKEFHTQAEEQPREASVAQPSKAQSPALVWSPGHSSQKNKARQPILNRIFTFPF